MGSFQKTIGPVSLGQVNIGANLAIAALIPVLAEIDVQIGLIGSLKADASAQFNAAVNFQTNFANPITTLINAIKASIQVIAGLQASLALGIPPLTVQISASVSIAAAALVKLGLLNAAIDVALGVVGVGANALAGIQGAASAGPVVGYGWSGITMSALESQFAAYNFGADGFSPSTPVYGILILTGAPSAFAGLSVLFLTA